MSVEVFIRKPDGTAWEGRINYNFSGKREDDFKLKFEDNTIPPAEKVYQSFGVSSTLEIAPSRLPDLGDHDSVYRFLYGYTLNELMDVDESQTVSYYASWLNEPQKWEKPMVLVMDWDLFCLSYYTLLYTCNSFKSKPWKVLLNILQIMKQDQKILPAVLLQHDRIYNDTACAEFWETIYNGLCTKVLYWLKEQTCYTAYEALSQIRSILPDDRYQELERECCAFWADVARKRIDEETLKPHSVNELVNFDGEPVFFYREFFALTSTDESTKQYIVNATYNFLGAIGDKIFAAGDVLSADSVYEAALKFSRSDEEKAAIIRKRNNIASQVATAKSVKEKEQLRYEKQRRKNRRKDRFVKTAAKAILAAVAICVLLLVVFGIFALLGIFETLAKTVLIIALGVIVVFVLYMVIMNALDKK